MRQSQVKAENFLKNLFRERNRTCWLWVIWMNEEEIRIVGEIMGTDESEKQSQLDKVKRITHQRKEASQVLGHVVRGILIQCDGTADIDSKMTRNFLAKGAMLVRSIFTLWDIEAYQECLILYRCLVDRLFHLHKLTKDDSFDSFDDWSFVKWHELFARLRADPRYKSQTDKHPPVPDEDKRRYSKLKEKGVKWKKPEPKEIAKTMQRDYLYLYGYEYASMQVHPMSNDGIQDFKTITGLMAHVEFPSHENVLRNSLLVLWLLTRDAVNYTTLNFSVLLDDFMLKFFDYLETGSLDYMIPYYALLKEFMVGKEWIKLKPQKFMESAA